MEKECKYELIPHENGVITIKTYFNVDPNGIKYISSKFDHLCKYNGNLPDGTYHLCVLSDDEIKEDNWFIHLSHNDGIKIPISEPIKAGRKFEIEGSMIIQHSIYENQYYNPKNCKKIIAITDQSLTIQNPCNNMDKMACYVTNCPKDCTRMKFLPRLPDEFIQEFCKKGGIDKVMVEYEMDCSPCVNVTVFSCDIQKCNNHKLKVASDNTISIRSVKEKTYTQKEVDELLDRNTCQVTQQILDKYKDYLSREEVIELLYLFGNEMEQMNYTKPYYRYDEWIEKINFGMSSVNR